LFYISPSWGADRELRWAEAKELAVFKNLGEVPLFIAQQTKAKP